MLAALLLLQAAIPTNPVAPVPAKEPTAALKGVVVDAIRACPTNAMGEIVVCSRDRGFAEGWRAKKLEKPKPVDGGGGIRIEVRGSTDLAPPGP